MCHMHTKWGEIILKTYLLSIYNKVMIQSNKHNLSSQENNNFFDKIHERIESLRKILTNLMLMMIK